MSVVADLVLIADRITDFINRKAIGDRYTFENLIDPLYLQLDKVVFELKDMYRPAAQELDRLGTELQKIQQNLVEEEFCKAKYKKIRVAGSYKDRESIDKLLNEIQTRSSSLFEEKYGAQLRESIERFRTLRESTKTERLKVDAASRALIEYFSDRSDVFSSRICDFSWQIRALVGRAEVHRVDNFSRELRPNRDGVYEMSRIVLGISETEFGESLLMEIYEPPRVLVPEVAHAREIDLDAPPNNSSVYSREPIELAAQEFANNCNSIEKCWNSILYIYASLRLLVDRKYKTAQD